MDGATSFSQMKFSQMRFSQTRFSWNSFYSKSKEEIGKS